MRIYIYIDIAEGDEVEVSPFEMPFAPPVGTRMRIYPEMLADEEDVQRLFCGRDRVEVVVTGYELDLSYVMHGWAEGAGFSVNATLAQS